MIPSLRSVLEAAAEDAGIGGTTDADGTRTWSAGGRIFATLDPNGTTATFRLDPVLAAAARRTLDAGPSHHGGEWVRFSPAVVDGHAEDRARAWFAAAVRRATA